ncbi:pilus assembly protein PilX [Pseudoalteromonas sp. MMG024]|uniref:pilus assembly PilX family protein n=1 Tax=Pseudoalteromonas sp. MMG024 TaxID=2909980 RepID=UPI001F468433|nr:pilus assembly protein PilX [Pseudoalteromonas sp. MMG024]MCF6457112.1 pilus assembly protein PilX [Pseudoalteromonas sp. MMG024]
MGNLKIKLQKGVVLIAAMLMLLMVSGIAITVMSGSALDSKMVNASQDTYRAESLTKGDTELAIKNELQSGAGNRFIIKRSAYPVSQQFVINSNGTTIVMTNENTNPVVDLLDCPPKFAATSGIKCNYLRLNSTQNYGKKDRHTMNINTGIQQEMMGN